jgi:hypothetical protein
VSNTDNFIHATSSRAEENDYRNDYPENDDGLDAAGAFSSDGGFSDDDSDAGGAGGDSSDDDADRDARMGGWGGGDDDY